MEVNKNINIFNINDNSNDSHLLINFDENIFKFNFYDNRKNFFGSFRIIQFIKYLTYSICPEFLKDIEHTSSVNIIEKYICTKSINELDNSVLINLKSNLESNFMGNIDMLIKLYKSINNFVINNFEIEIKKSDCDSDKSRKISKCIKNLIYLILNHSLKLIATISEMIKNDPTKNNIAKTLLQYSVAIMNKITSFTKIEFENKIKEIKNINDNSIKLEKINEDINNKMTKILESINQQNLKITELTSNINSIKLDGGLLLNSLAGGFKNSPLEDYMFESSSDNSPSSSSKSSKSSSTSSKSSKSSESSESSSSSSKSSKSSSTSSKSSDNGFESSKSSDNGFESSKSSENRFESSKSSENRFESNKVSKSDCYYTESGNVTSKINYLTPMAEN